MSAPRVADASFGVLFPLAFITASTTPARTVFLDKKVVAGIGVTGRAMCDCLVASLEHLSANATQNVYLPSDRLQVVGIDAGSYSTEVVQLQSRRDRSPNQFIRYSMGEFALFFPSLHHSQSPVASGINRPHPHPAAALGDRHRVAKHPLYAGIDGDGRGKWSVPQASESSAFSATLVAHESFGNMPMRADRAGKIPCASLRYGFVACDDRTSVLGIARSHDMGPFGRFAARNSAIPLILCCQISRNNYKSSAPYRGV